VATGFWHKTASALGLFSVRADDPDDIDTERDKENYTAQHNRVLIICSRLYARVSTYRTSFVQRAQEPAAQDSD
jgi:hypothetical protein